MKAERIVPKSSAECGIGSCPGIFRADDGRCFVVGKKGRHLPPEVVDSIGPDEDAVEVPASFIEELKK